MRLSGNKNLDVNVVIDKHKILPRIKELDVVKLELGCGPRKRIPDALTIDKLDYDCVDLVGDIFDVLKLLPNQSVDYIFSYHFFEHVSDLGHMMDEIDRVLKWGGTLDTVVPHFSNPHYYSDYTHRTSFGIYTFDYLTFNSYFTRTSPTYQKQINFKLERVDLKFGSFRPYYFRHGIRMILGKLINSTKYTKEFYEENLCYLLPCSEIRFLLTHSTPPSPNQ